MIVKELQALIGTCYEYGFWARHNGLGYSIAALVILAPSPYTIFPFFFDHPPPEKYPMALGVICLFAIFCNLILEFLARNKYQSFTVRSHGLEYKTKEQRTENLLWSDIKQIKDLTEHKANAWGALAIEVVTKDGRSLRIYSKFRQYDEVVNALKLQTSHQIQEPTA